ncbi:MAG TPA: TolC family protein [Terracidiphilus sp.]|nr:TolC family protein [Terracidiphilus sp.]
MKWSAALACMMLAAAPALARAQVSLITVVQMAERNSASIRMAEADVRKARAGLSESRDVLIPSVDFSTGLPVFPEVGFTGTPPSIWSASIQSLIFGVPQKRYIHAARLGLEAAAASLRDTEQQVVLDASTDYIELDTVNQEIAAAQQQQSYASNLVEIEQKRTDAGVDPFSDLLQAKLTAAQIKLNELHLETRAATLSKQLADLTALPNGSITPDHASIPPIPQISGDAPAQDATGQSSAELEARSKRQIAKGDAEISYLPQLSFGVQYFRNTTLLNNVRNYFVGGLPINNFSSGISIEVPVFNMFDRAKARASAADALRATVQAEEAARQHQIQIATLSSSLRELAAQEEIASLKQQIAEQYAKTVVTEMEVGTGAGIGSGAQAPPSPKEEEQARIDERQKYQDALEAELSLSKARLNLLRALGHMQDWLNELHGK